MARIAVICAFLPNRNTGMYTVDLSAYAYFQNAYPNDEIAYYALGPLEKLGYTPAETHQQYLPLQDHVDAVREADLIVFWGDFLHSKPYWEVDLSKWLVRDGICADHTAAIELIYRAFMLEDASDAVLGKVVVYGGTIITIGAGDLRDARYNAALRRLITRAGGIHFRDALSQMKSSPLRGNRSVLGSDCALQLSRDDFTRYGVVDAFPEQPGEKMGVFFGRAKWIAQPLALSRALAAQTGRKAQWIPWVDSAPRQLPLARLFGYPARRLPPLPRELLASLLECRFVLTDTYHLCVNAWNLGIPAVCLGYGSQHVAHTLGDKKKEILFAQYGASPYYLYREHIANPVSIPATAKHIARLVEQDDMARIVTATIHEQAAAARARLAESCDSVLGRT
ncbi:polysaccharide pyruvyl transferase family protein [Novosphingobium pokkalii]|uniref:Polysaccharide pyruvyl transferase family protein n=1 Tax=Novosphingobium pokkalii TaxID=1770194 RepID=A0ABV7V7B4_9SPHN|nr:polysaccharide pyruvyl transferase family protein [Novosphingobium pokkalii]GHC91783.1 hypothetical protein GCM10019060_17200 [Novosphingobium pokkalii]